MILQGPKFINYHGDFLQDSCTKTNSNREKNGQQWKKLKELITIIINTYINTVICDNGSISLFPIRKHIPFIDHDVVLISVKVYKVKAILQENRFLKSCKCYCSFQSCWGVSFLTFCSK